MLDLDSWLDVDCGLVCVFFGGFDVFDGVLVEWWCWLVLMVCFGWGWIWGVGKLRGGGDVGMGGDRNRGIKGLMLMMELMKCVRDVVEVVGEWCYDGDEDCCVSFKSGFGWDMI